MKIITLHSALLSGQLRFFLIPFMASLFLYSCNVNFIPLPTLEERQFLREKAIEDHVHRTIREQDMTNRYESLAFGPLLVYKTDDHLLLDSLFDVKYSYVEDNNMRAFRKAGLQKMLDEQRQKAKKREDELLFEMEHIYMVHAASDDSISVHHDYIVLNNSDSVITHTKFYHYTFDKDFKEMAINYLFELHFITRRSSYLTDAELDFIRFFKERESELIGSSELGHFMRHTLALMQIAQAMNSVNYVTLTKYIAMRHLLARYNQREVLNFFPLNMVEENGNLVGYNLSFEWMNSQIRPSAKMISEIEFSPYLEVIRVSDRFESEKVEE